MHSSEWKTGCSSLAMPSRSLAFMITLAVGVNRNQSSDDRSHHSPDTQSVAGIICRLPFQSAGVVFDARITPKNH